jgi:hypothetical protein
MGRHCSFEVPLRDNNFDYWVPMIKFFFEKANYIEVHCWNKEKEIIDEILTEIEDEFEIKDTQKYDNMTIFKGPLTNEIKKFFLSTNILSTNIITTIDELKWFSVFLRHNSVLCFCSSHWGTEFFVPNVSQEDITFIQSIMPKNIKYLIYDSPIIES